MSTVLPIYNVGEWDKIEIAWSKNIHIHLLVYVVKVFIIYRYTEISVFESFSQLHFFPQKTYLNYAIMNSRNLSIVASF